METKKLVHNHFSTHAAVLQTHNPTTKTTSTRSIHPPYYRPVTICLTTNDKQQNYEMSPLCLKRKTQHESQSIVTNTTTDLIHPIEADWEEVLDDLIKQNNIHLANKLDKKK